MWPLIRKPPLRNDGTWELLCLHWNWDFQAKGKFSTMFSGSGGGYQVPWRLGLELEIGESQVPKTLGGCRVQVWPWPVSAFLKRPFDHPWGPCPKSLGKAGWEAGQGPWKWPCSVEAASQGWWEAVHLPLGATTEELGGARAQS